MKQFLNPCFDTFWIEKRPFCKEKTYDTLLFLHEHLFFDVTNMGAYGGLVRVACVARNRSPVLVVKRKSLFLPEDGRYLKF
jgi:hypothetical protein